MPTGNSSGILIFPRIDEPIGIGKVYLKVAGGFPNMEVVVVDGGVNIWPCN